ncbi:SRPBCC domain-containing protein [Parapedobacter lycopersici]|uniref:SRPBCC domain-containing protein n=1 Tax=Parapedobacter lycopersici TaxID=1864939 RepID=UPI00214D3826|nr:SRPBCC domain-containing protein [Parapedobacter lycopersici]
MKDYKAYFIIPASPSQVYLALTVETTIHLWTGEEAQMEAVPDTEFSMWGGSIVGKNLAFEPDKKIVQEWYFGNETEQSIVTIKLHEHKQGTSMEVRQSNIPDEAYDDIVDGWQDTYAAALIDFYLE